jgi:2-phospho-L-lactate guanylyltransferase
MASTAGLWVVVPARGIARGKSRLAAVLDAAQRARLNRWMLANTLEIVSRWQHGLSRCVVVSTCPRILLIARRSGAHALREPRPSRGLNRAIAHALAVVRRRSARSVLILPVDLPLLSVEALDRMVDSMASGVRCVIAPDAARTGTNALLLRARARFDCNFGRESFVRHLDVAKAAGLGVAVSDHPHLWLDVDTPNDFTRWIERSDRRFASRRVLYSGQR